MARALKHCASLAKFLADQMEACSSSKSGAPAPSRAAVERFERDVEALVGVAEHWGIDSAPMLRLRDQFLRRRPVRTLPDEDVCRHLLVAKAVALLEVLDQDGVFVGEAQRSLLTAARKLGAVGVESRRTGDELCQAAFGRMAKRRGTVLSELVRMKLLAKVGRGPGAGYYLTAKGLELAE
jgi:hypothetical protein